VAAAKAAADKAIAAAAREVSARAVARAPASSDAVFMTLSRVLYQAFCFASYSDTSFAAAAASSFCSFCHAAKPVCAFASFCSAFALSDFALFSLASRRSSPCRAST